MTARNRIDASSDCPPRNVSPRRPLASDKSLDLQPLVFHVKASEALVVERALRRFGSPRRRRGAALTAAIRAANAAQRNVRRRHAEP